MFCFIGKHQSRGITENRFFNNFSRLVVSILQIIKYNQLAPNSLNPRKIEVAINCFVGVYAIEYILVSQLDLILLKLGNSDDEISPHCLYCCLWANFVSFMFLPNIILSIMCYFFVFLFLYFTKHLNKQSHGLHSKNVFTKVLLISAIPIDILLWYARIGVFESA